MKYELIHDTIAQQINDKASLEAKARRRLRLLVERQYERHLANPRILLTGEDLVELAPFVSHLSFSAEEQAFIQRSRRAVHARRNMILGSVAAVIVLLTILLLWALYQGNAARAESRRAKAIALAGKSLEAQLDGDLTRSLGLAQASYRLDSAAETLKALYRAFLRPDAHYYSINREGLEYRDLNAFLSPRPPYYLLTMAPDGVVIIWNEALEKVARLEGHRSFVNAASFSGDGRMLVTGATDSTARIWRLADSGNAELLAVMPHGGEVRNVHWSAGEPVILTVSSASRVLRWDTTGRLLDTLLQRPSNYRLTLSADGAFIAGSTPAYTCFWDASGKQIDSLRNPFQPRTMLFGPPLAGSDPACYPLFIKGFTAAGIYRWRPGSGALTLIPNQDQGIEGAIAVDLAQQGVAFSLASFLRRENDQAAGLIKVWTFEPGGTAVSGQFAIPEYGADNFIPLLHPNRRWLYSISDGQTIRRWELGPGANPFTVAARLTEETECQWLQRSAVAFQEGDSLRLLTLPGGERSITFPLGLRRPELAVTLAGKRVARWEAGTTSIEVSDLSGKLLGTIETGMILIRTLCFSEDGRRLLAAGYGQDKHQLRLWNTADGSPPLIFELPAPPLDVRFDPAGTDRLFLINENADIRYLAIAGQQLRELDTIPIALGDPDELDIVHWPASPPEGEKVPGGTLLIHTRYDSINIWEQSATGRFELYQTLISADEAFEGARFPSAPPLWISMEGGAMQLRRLSRGSPLLAAIEGIKDVRFTADGQTLMVLTSGGELQAWPWRPEAILQRIDSMHIAVPKDELQRLDL